MDERLKQRLTGAAVLVSLAVVFIPMLLKGPAEPAAPDITATNIPPKPQQGFQSRIIPLNGEKAAGVRPKVASAAPAETAAPEAAASSGAQGTKGMPTPAAGAAAGSPPPASGTSASAPAPSASKESASKLPAVGTAQAEAAAGDASGGKAPAAAAAANAPGAAGKEKVGVTAWAVQLGSFSNEQNAVALTGRLRKKGYTAFLETGSSGQGTVTRVFVGPELERDGAVAAQKKLRDEFKLNGIVVRYPGG